ncbi:energy-converting hydrogenase Eha subunit E [Bradyrhizobium japonicum USDA 38]|nr:energy-converting hydrogenase Eha subunit E [Bradyrhizobium japonicum USDA 38]MCS3943031.1 energy-converting hydrogenase Eha subunit E [Bradyrhizobium japonicum]
MLFIAVPNNLTLVLFRPILRYGSHTGTAPK